MTTKQVETSTVVGTITLTGNASVTVTALGMTNSPKTISVAVTDTNTASIVGGLIRTALAFDVDVAAMFLVSGAGADVVLTKHIAAANDSTLNIAITNGTCTGLTPALTSTNTTAGTGLTNGYCTLAEIKAIDVLNISNTDHDTILESVIEGVSRAIDNYCARRFYNAVETRYYGAEFGRTIYVDDIASASGLTIYTDDGHDGTYEYTWASTDFELLPYNAAFNGLPFTQIETTANGSYRFPRGRKGVKITASFGFPAVPKPVNRACVLQATRLFKRYITPLGVSAAIIHASPSSPVSVKSVAKQYSITSASVLSPV